MNKLYLLVALGLTVKADVTSSTTGIDTSSDGWYAGDCLDDTDFSDYYDYVDFNCGDSCYTNYQGGSDDVGADYAGCYEDETCNKYVKGCYEW
jgi:hypothetical protein